MAVYIARVRITVRTDTGAIIREGHGTGEGTGTSAGEAHDMALKAAETDATKRALATFGKPFGLGLYLGDHRPKPALDQRQDYAGRESPQGGPAITDQTQRPARSQPATSPTPSSSPTADSDRPATRAAQDVAAPPTKITAALRQAAQVTPLDKLKRRRDPRHLAFVAAQPCLICGRQPADAHHLRFVQPRAMGRKVSDEFTVPLCRTHHRQLHHDPDEQAWWRAQGIEPLEIARELWTQSQQDYSTPERDTEQAGSSTAGSSAG